MGKHLLNHVRWRYNGAGGLPKETYQEYLERRFWSKVVKSDGDGCWVWRAGLRRKKEGYGQFFLDGKPVAAHRMALMLSGVMLSRDEVVAHRCDNPPCVRPDHLFVTTNRGNTRDRFEKGRSASHQQNGNAKLSDADVERLRKEHEEGAQIMDLADRYGISRTHVWRLVTNKMRKPR
jgi:hypothetical protein